MCIHRIVINQSCVVGVMYLTIYYICIYCICIVQIGSCFVYLFLNKLRCGNHLIGLHVSANLKYYKYVKNNSANTYNTLNVNSIVMCFGGHLCVC